MDVDYNQAKEIVNVELTAYEFAEALSLRPDALFVKQMFALIDADSNGYISFREFLNVVVIFAKGLILFFSFFINIVLRIFSMWVIL